MFLMEQKEQRAMASEKNLQELFHETLRTSTLRRRKSLTTLPEMAQPAQSQQLKAAFELHETETGDP